MSSVALTCQMTEASMQLPYQSFNLAVIFCSRSLGNQSMPPRYAISKHIGIVKQSIET